MKKIAVVYTSMGGLVKTMNGLLKEALPDAEIVNIADDSLIREVIRAGGVTDGVRERMMHYFRAAETLAPDMIISACSSVGAVAEEANRLLETPVVRIDRAMIEAALERGTRIGVLASLGTTVEPTCDYIRRIAEERGMRVEVLPKVAQGAYEANAAGNAAEHDALIKKAADELSGAADVIILAQGSMARMERILEERLNKPVFSSPALCVKSAASYLNGGAK